MKYFTKIKIPKSEATWSYGQKILSLGSCFAERIADHLGNLKWDIIDNPTGIHFNPISLSSISQRALHGDDLDPQELQQDGEVYFHWQFPSYFSDIDSGRAFAQMNSAYEQLKELQKGANWIVVSLGTAWAYRHLANREIVCNCHKQSQDQFEKVLLTVAEMHESIRKWTDTLVKKNPSVKFLFTVSPIRHIKDGIVENQRSKSRLIELCHILQSENFHYFPSYEIMMDELRDYRWYKEDMIHPTDQATEHIIERFTACYLDAKSQELMQKVQNLQTQFQHKIFHPYRESSQRFQQNLAEKMKHLSSNHPAISFKPELEVLEKKLN